MGTFIDLTGQEFGRLTVLEQAENSRRGRTRWTCRCECGTERTVRTSDLRSGRTLSCGCLRREATSQLMTKHGMSNKSRFYRVWAEMRRRCNNPNANSYPNYGGRGIAVCSRWDLFENFRDDLYESYLQHVDEHGEKDTTIERKDVNGNYQPSNVRWATRMEQARNRRSIIRAAGVRQRPNGMWEAHLKRDGQRYNKTFASKEMALAWREQKLKEVTGL